MDTRNSQLYCTFSLKLAGKKSFCFLPQLAEPTWLCSLYGLYTVCTKPWKLKHKTKITTKGKNYRNVIKWLNQNMSKSANLQGLNRIHEIKG